jgi:hypothetical protein
MFNYYFDAERDAHADTVKLFEEIKQGKYEAYTSVYVTDELEVAPEPKRSKMFGLITEYGVTVLNANEETASLADIYVTQGIIPVAYRTDGRHIACTAVNGLDMILSLNFKHIVKKKTIELTEFVNLKEGYRKVGIYTPMEVVENDEDL